ncbi:MAG: hypothetical protein HY238_14395, partial [Acidobacteria bacterium]|nr:hypothetical protein [Acidobacteriota bacterium]
MTRPVRRERGYALLAVLFFGAVMAIMLGLSLPRAAFEAQRANEDDLMYRGGQYSRAVQLYFRKNKRYPARLEDLEKTNNVRFLRRKYEDPITKKDEWRFIHIGPAGMFTDSLVYDKPKPKKEGEPGSAGSAPGSGFPDMGTGSTTTGAPPVTGMADRLRAAGAQPPPGSDPNAFPGVQPPPGGQLYFNQPAVVAGQPGAYPAGAGGAVPVYGQPSPGPQAYPGQQYAGQPYPGQQYPGQQYPGQQYPGQQYPAQQYPGQPYPGQPGAQAFPAGGFPGAQTGVVRGVPGGMPGFAAPGGAFG